MKRVTVDVSKPFLRVLLAVIFATGLTLAWADSQTFLLKVVSAQPWELELLKEDHSQAVPFYFFAEQTGLPRVTARFWKNTGRDLLPNDVGKTFECKISPLIFDPMSDPITLYNEDKNLSFESIWKATYVNADAEELKDAFWIMLVFFAFVFFVFPKSWRFRRTMMEALLFIMCAFALEISRYYSGFWLYIAGLMFVIGVIYLLDSFLISLKKASRWLKGGS